MKSPAKIYGILVIAFLSMLLSGIEAHAQKISIKTNILELGVLTPNLGVEVVTGEKSSIDVSIMGHVRPYGMQSNLLSIQPEYRYWLSGRPMINAFVGATAHGSIHKMTIHDQFCNGASFGLGVTAGYVLALGKKWNMEFTGGLAASYFFQKQYSVKDSDHIIPASMNSRGYKVLPVDLGVTVTYIIR